MLYLGCDPGLRGGFVLLDKHSRIISAWEMPKAVEPRAVFKLLLDVEEISLRVFEPVFFAIEKVITIPSDVVKIQDLVEKIKAAQDDKVRQAAARDLSEAVKKRDGRVGVLAMGINFGVILGAASGFGWKIMIVPPRTWQSQMWPGVLTKASSKDRTFEVCKNLWPTFDFSLEGRHKKFHDGVTDAAAIAEYARRLYQATK